MMASVDPLQLLGEAHGSSFFVLLLTGFGEVHGGVVRHGEPVLGLSHGDFTHFTTNTAETLFADEGAADLLGHDCVRNGCARVTAHPEQIAKVIASADATSFAHPSRASYTPWSPQGPRLLSAMAAESTFAATLARAGVALGILIAGEISQLREHRVRVVGPAELVDEQWTSAELYLGRARQTAKSLGLGGELILNSSARSADEIDQLVAWLEALN